MRYKESLVAYFNEQLLEIHCTLPFATLMELGSVKVILIFFRRLKVTAHHGDVLNAYVRYVDINVRVPMGLQVGEEILKQHGDRHTEEVALLFEKSLNVLRPESSGTSCSTRIWLIRVSCSVL